MDVSIECELKGVVTREDEEGSRHLAMVLPSTCATIKGSIPTGENSYDDDDLILSDQYGNCLSVSGLQDIEALAGFLLLFIDRLRGRDAGLEDEVPKDAKVGPISEEEIESMSVQAEPDRIEHLTEDGFSEGTTKMSKRDDDREMVL